MAPVEARVVTLLLDRWRAGDEEASDELVRLVYPNLRRIAAAQMRDERVDHTLSPTALVHEAYARLLDVELSFESRAHFLAMASRVMRRILVDHARARAAAKRGSDRARVTVRDEHAVVVPSYDVLDLDEALEELSLNEERAARVVEAHYFGGLTYREISESLAISEATVERDLRFAKAWLRRRLEKGRRG